MSSLPSSEPAVALRDVTVTYPGRREPALESVDLELTERDFLGVVGPNGGGKTTLLRLILGLVAPDRGRVEIFGQPPRAARSRVGYVPQSARLEPSVPATVLDVVLLGRTRAGSWGPRFGSEDRDAAREALERTHTTDLAELPVTELSGGQRQRVLIARALAGEPEVLLLDEPTTGVDIHREKELLSLLLRLNEDLPIVLVTHDLALVGEHLKRCAFVNRRLAVQPARELTLESIECLYHGPPGAHAPC